MAVEAGVSLREEASAGLAAMAAVGVTEATVLLQEEGLVELAAVAAAVEATSSLRGSAPLLPSEAEAVAVQARGRHGLHPTEGCPVVGCRGEAAAAAEGAHPLLRQLTAPQRPHRQRLHDQRTKWAIYDASASLGGQGAAAYPPLRRPAATAEAAVTPAAAAPSSSPGPPQRAGSAFPGGCEIPRRGGGAENGGVEGRAAPATDSRPSLVRPQDRARALHRSSATQA